MAVREPLKPGRVGYLPIVDRPALRWPHGARLALWVAPNIEHYEYLPPVRPVRDPWPRMPHPDVMNYAYRDYGNRVGFWRMLDVLDRYEIPCTVSLNVAVLEHFPEIKQAMLQRDWRFMSHGIYNTRYLAGLSEDEERAFHQDTIDTVLRHTGQRMLGMLGPSITNSERTPDLMAEAGMIYHADWAHDDQPVPITVRSGKLISMPYSVEVNDVAVRQQLHEGEYFVQLIKDQFDCLYAEGADSGRVMCIALHPYVMGHPHRIQYLDQALAYIRSHDQVWLTTADEIALHYMAHCYDEVAASLKHRRHDRLPREHDR